MSRPTFPRPKDDDYKHETGDKLLDLLSAAEDALGTLEAHVLAVIANGKVDPNWTGWIPALEALVPNPTQRKENLKRRLREAGLDDLADRMEYLDEHSTGSGDPGGSVET